MEYVVSMYAQGERKASDCLPEFFATRKEAIEAGAAEVARVAGELTRKGGSPVNMTAPPLMHGTALFLAIGAFVAVMLTVAIKRYRQTLD